MQRFAFSIGGDRVEASEALHHIDYLCPECRGILRLRRGEQRVPHFFHKTEGESCHLRQKEGFHQAVQAWLEKELGTSSCTCECFFPEISRVADIAFTTKKVIFEVQVSPMKPEEALQRTLDYWSIGWHVIWLLHASTFGRFKATDFEEVLNPIPHYFTDIGFREGTIWDEMSCVQGKRRFWFSLPPKRQKITFLSINILRPPTPLATYTPVFKTAQECLQMRKESWSCHLEGDFLSTKEVLEHVRDGKKLFDFHHYTLLARLLWLKFLGA